MLPEVIENDSESNPDICLKHTFMYNILHPILLHQELPEAIKTKDSDLFTLFSKEDIFLALAKYAFNYNNDFDPCGIDQTNENIQSSIQQYLSEQEIAQISKLNINLGSFQDIPNHIISSNQPKTFFLSKQSFEILVNMPNSFYANEIPNNIKFCNFCYDFLMHNILLKVQKFCMSQLDITCDTFSEAFIESRYFGLFADFLFTCFQWDSPLIFQPDVYQSRISSLENNKNHSKRLILGNLPTNHPNLSKIEMINNDITRFGLSLSVADDQQDQKTISIGYQTHFDLSFVVRLFIHNIHDNCSIPYFLGETLNKYPEYLPDSTIISYLSEIACHKLPTAQLSDLPNKLCNSFDACYTLTTIYSQLNAESPIYFYFNKAEVLNNILTAALFISKASPNRYQILISDLIQIVTQSAKSLKSLVNSINLPVEFQIHQDNINDNSIAAIELYLLILKKDEDESNRNASLIKSSSYTFSKYNFYSTPNRSNNSHPTLSTLENTYQHECKLFKLFFKSEKLQDKLLRLFLYRPTQNVRRILPKSFIPVRNMPRFNSTPINAGQHPMINTDFLRSIAEIPNLVDSICISYSNSHELPDDPLLLTEINPMKAQLNDPQSLKWSPQIAKLAMELSFLESSNTQSLNSRLWTLIVQTALQKMKDIIESPYGEEDHIRKRSLTDDVMQFTPSPHMFDNLVMKETEPQQEVQASSKVEKEKEKSTKDEKTKQSIRVFSYPLKNTNVFSNCDYEYRNSTDDEKREAYEKKEISPPHSHTSSNDDDDDGNSNSTEFIIDI